MNFSTHDRRRVLLIDGDALKQRIRAAALRNCEVEVHTADGIADAGNLFARGAYDLVLFAAEEHSQEATLLCEELRKNRPKQRIALLVGAPQYIREIGRKRPVVQDTVATVQPSLQLQTPQPNQWQGTIERLLAAH
jgi:response regulator RpfG family c-di-GMP phosphodiesterase